MSAFLDVSQAAKMLGCHRDTIYKLIASGELKAFRMTETPRSHYRISLTAMDRYIKRKERHARSRQRKENR